VYKLISCFAGDIEIYLQKYARDIAFDIDFDNEANAALSLDEIVNARE